MSFSFLYRLVNLLIVLLLLVGLTSCGQTGDLYLPPEDEQENDAEDQ